MNCAFSSFRIGLVSTAVVVLVVVCVLVFRLNIQSCLFKNEKPAAEVTTGLYYLFPEAVYLFLFNFCDLKSKNKANISELELLRRLG